MFRLPFPPLPTPSPHHPCRAFSQRPSSRFPRLSARCASIGAALVAAVAGAATPAGGESQDPVPAEAPRPTVEIVTSMGAMTVALRPDRAPRTVANFLALVDDGFYDGLVFHRVIPAFMIQAGGFDEAMKPRKAPRTVVNESIGGLPNKRGTVAMARTSDPDSAGAQFYVNVVDSAYLDATPGAPGYTVFGEVVAGLDVADKISETPTGNAAGMPNVPVTTVKIVSARRGGSSER